MPRKKILIRLDDDQIKFFEKIKEDAGTSINESIRRACKLYMQAFEEQGYIDVEDPYGTH